MDTKKLVIYKNGRYVEVAGSGGGGGAGLTKVTHAELLALRNAGQLVPGAKYRITDYECIIADSEDFRAVSHPFDIIVTADSESSLNENCSATLHEGDEYFKNCQLESWELKYSIDNGARLWGKLGGLVVSAPGFGDVGIKTSRTAEFGGETYDVWDITPTVSAVLGVTEMYVLAGQTPATTDECFVDALGTGDLFSISDASGMSLPLTVSQGAGGKGVIYWMKDNLGNEAYYDFKGIQFYITDDNLRIDGGWFYPFSYIVEYDDDGNPIAADDTVYARLDAAAYNVIKGGASSSLLNKFVAMSSDNNWSAGHIIGNNCHDIVLLNCQFITIAGYSNDISIASAQYCSFGSVARIKSAYDNDLLFHLHVGSGCTDITFEWNRKGYIENTTIDNSIHSIVFSGDSYMTDVTIHKGVQGASKSDPLELTIPFHTGEYNIVAAGSVTKEV